MTASLNFKTGHVHDDFVDLTDRIHDMMDERLERITAEFQKRADAIVDGITTRVEQVHADLDVIAGRIDQRYPGRTTSLAIRVLSTDPASQTAD